MALLCIGPKLATWTSPLSCVAHRSLSSFPILLFTVFLQVVEREFLLFSDTFNKSYLLTMPRAVLDSSPLRTDTANRDTFQAAQTRMPSRPLKRSASAASLASLPTPPQTIQHKGRYAHSRSRSRGSGQGSDEDADEDEALDSGRGASTSRRRLVFGRKRQRTDHLDAVLASLSGEDSENPFWDGAAATGEDASTKGEDRGKTTIQSSSQSIVDSTTRGKAPVSPPPSRRQTSVHQRRQSESAPSTPKTKVRERCGWSDPEDTEGDPIRDSPNNPFLDDSPMSVTAEPIEPRTPTEQAEKPTLAYVLSVIPI